MIMRSFFATILISLSFLTAQGQASNLDTDPARVAAASSLSGTYRISAMHVDCDSMVTKLVLNADGKTDGGTYKLTKTFYYANGTKTVHSKHTGEWFLLENKEAVHGDKTTIIVVEVLDRLETYPLFIVRKDGSLLQLNQESTERFPLYVGRKNGQMVVARKGGPDLLLEDGLHYKDIEKGFKDPTRDHILRKIQ